MAIRATVIGGDNVQRIAVAGTFLRGDWPTSNTGEITCGGVTWAP